MKTEVINSILMDDLKEAETLLTKQPHRSEMLLTLLNKVKNRFIPLKALKAKAPKSLGILTSYTCGLRCEMCSSGFYDRTF